MAVSLNFSKGEKDKIREFLQQFPAQKTGTAFEEMRVRIGGSVVTLYTSGKLLIQGGDAESVKEQLIHNMGVEGELLLGIDEAGRGERHGSFTVAAVLGNTNDLRCIRDSKKTGNLKRAKEEILRHSMGHLVLLKTAGEIDRLRQSGKTMNDIEAEMIASIAQNFKENGFKGRILVDGKPLKKGLKGIEFMPRADDLNPVVGAASILAKTARDESADRAERKTWKKMAKKPN